MTFEDLLLIDDPSTLEAMSEQELRSSLSSSLNDCPPIEAKWLQSKLEVKAKKVVKKKDKKVKDTKEKEMLMTQIMSSGVDVEKAMGDFMKQRK
jgi:hypothetical protein